MNWFGETRDYYGQRWFDGMELAYPERWRRFDSALASATLIKREATPDRVAVVISGGGSDGPWIPGFVGEGLADAAVIGAPYTAPNAYAIYEVSKALGKQKGVLLLYNNFMGDYLNNDMAAELLQLEGYRVEQVACCDDMGMAIGEPKENRGGRLAAPYLIKIAAKAAAQGKSLEEVAALVRKAAARSSTLCVTVDTEDDVVTYGKGFSDEPGFNTREHETPQSAAEETIRLLVDDVQPREGERVCLLVNRMRLTCYADSYIMAGYLHAALSARCPVMQTRVGAYSNILNLYGYTVTLLCADDEIAPYLDGALASDSFMI